MTLELAQVIIEGVAAAGLVITLVLILRQFRLQRSDLEHRIYQQIADRYSALLWLAAEDPSLDNVWKSLSDREEAWISAQAALDNRWTVWAALESADSTMPFDAIEEKRMYRYTRACLELCEQAFLAHEAGAVSSRIWKKYERVLAAWTTSRWFTHVLTENRTRFDASFCQVADRISKGSA